MKQTAHIPTSTQLTEQPQMSSSSGASVHVLRKLASQLQPSLEVLPHTDGYKHLKISRPFSHAET